MSPSKNTYKVEVGLWIIDYGIAAPSIIHNLNSIICYSPKENYCG